jgi:hypothetical protein
MIGLKRRFAAARQFLTSDVPVILKAVNRILHSPRFAEHHGEC